ncbi:hypothetical protein BT96DRAFT_1000454 [Gymnopus androsaceus JB14]|uniref:Protein kinase domain-containing protein n=1 Tax=Gymnopus androsaceus JB14 TaxID=1447944 RepID=A0A6A4H3L1_9AGAR|nr:hypothetical protein BT96DRAFT_1000454 [Gymnopus androsaceus JB14]
MDPRGFLRSHRNSTNTVATSSTPQSASTRTSNHSFDTPASNTRSQLKKQMRGPPEIRIWLYNPTFDAFYRREKDGAIHHDFWILKTITNLDMSITHLLRDMDHPSMPALKGAENFSCALLVPGADIQGGAFHISPCCREVFGAVTLADVIDWEFKGICIVDKANSKLFVESYEDCQRRSADPLLRLPPGVRADLETHRCTAYAAIAFQMHSDREYTDQSLHRNGIYYWGEKELDLGLPNFVSAKVKQLQSKRDSLYWDPASIVYLQRLFDLASLDPSEFMTRTKELDASSSAANIPISDQSDSSNFLAEVDEIAFLCPREDTLKHCKEGSLEKDSIELFKPLVRWARTTFKSGANIIAEWKSSFMAIQDGNACYPIRARGEQTSKLVFIRPRMDFSMFYYREPLVFVEVDSGGVKASNSPTDKKRGLAHAAFFVRLANMALGITDFCLPVIWVSKLWTAECHLVYQHGSRIIAYPLKYGESNVFPLDNLHARAHFHVRLLNMIDPRMHQLSKAQDKVIGGLAYFICEWWIGRWSTGEYAGSPYLELPHYRPVGNELKKSRGSRLEGRSLSLCDQLMTGVNFLHSQLQVAHMDLKPDNLVFDLTHARVQLKIINFNLSIMNATRPEAPGTRGTRGYMAPEVEGPMWYSPLLADLYSCGVCMDELLNVDQGQNQENINSSFEIFVVFAARLRNQSPSKRPPLTERPKLTRPQHQRVGSMQPLATLSANYSGRFQGN